MVYNVKGEKCFVGIYREGLKLTTNQKQEKDIKKK